MAQQRLPLYIKNIIINSVYKYISNTSRPINNNGLCVEKLAETYQKLSKRTPTVIEKAL